MKMLQVILFVFVALLVMVERASTQLGSLQTGSTGEPSLFLQGQYQYTAPDGEVINGHYRADDNGFEVQGDNIPTPPPIPPLIQRTLDYLATTDG